MTELSATPDGTSYDLIIASGVITGSYTTINKAALFGFIAQRADPIQQPTHFLANPPFSPQVTRIIDRAYAAITP